MKVLITGSESFLGNFLKIKLKKNKIKYYGIDQVKNKETKKCNILSKKLVKNIENKTTSIIHLAAISSSKDFEKNPEKAFDVNVKGTINLLKAASQNNVRQIIFASTEWVYGEESKKKITEKAKINSNKLGSEYAISKHICEELIRYYCSKFNINYIILRFGIIYGPRSNKSNWSAVEALINKVHLGEKSISVGSKKTARRFIHAEDVCDAITTCLNYKQSETYNLSGDRLISLEEIINVSSSQLGKKTLIIEKNKSDFNFRNTDNDLIKKKLKWKPRKNLKSSINDIVDSFNALK